MSIEYMPVSRQGSGSFDGGKIEEHKPIPFPHEGGGFEPFSTLFYWAHAWSVPGGLIDLHPHKGFEIISYVLKGSIEHYDTILAKWLPLHAGCLQIIRSGSGVEHAERILPGSAIFQIWFDPGLAQSLGNPASYDDYRPGDFGVSNSNGMKITSLVGKNSPVRMDAPAEMKKADLLPGNHEIGWNNPYDSLICMISGSAIQAGQKILPGDVLKVTGESKLAIQAEEATELFIVAVPQKAPYATYVDSFAR